MMLSVRVGDLVTFLIIAKGGQCKGVSQSNIGATFFRCTGGV